jgi:hypothetical protein
MPRRGFNALVQTFKGRESIDVLNKKKRMKELRKIDQNELLDRKFDKITEDFPFCNNDQKWEFDPTNATSKQKREKQNREDKLLTDIVPMYYKYDESDAKIYKIGMYFMTEPEHTESKKQLVLADPEQRTYQWVETPVQETIVFLIGKSTSLNKRTLDQLSPLYVLKDGCMLAADDELIMNQYKSSGGKRTTVKKRGTRLKKSKYILKNHSRKPNKKTKSTSRKGK